MPTVLHSILWLLYLLLELITGMKKIKRINFI